MLNTMSQEKGRHVNHLTGTLAGTTILVVDDNPLNQQVLCAILKLGGVEGIVASNGIEAIEILKAQNVDAILLDIEMPLMNGFETMGIINDQFQEIPVIAMSASVDQADIKHYHDAKMKDHVAKPFRAAELFSVLEKWVEPKRPVSNRGTDFAQQYVDLPSISGINVAAGLNLIGDNMELYRSMLFLFMDLHSDVGQLIKETVIKGDRDRAREQAHNLRSAAGNIGAEKVYDLATKLENALKENLSSPMQLACDLAENLTTVVDAIQAYKKTESTQ